MLLEAHTAGIAAGLARFGIKEAGIADRAKGWAGTAAETLIGSPRKVLREGMGTFRPGGVLHHENVLWPNNPARPGASILGKGTAILSALPLLSALRGGGDPSEGRLTNTLSAAGSALGMAYGFPAAGMLGAPHVSRAGAAVGKGIGHFFGSRRHQPQQQEMQPQFTPPQYMQPQYMQPQHATHNETMIPPPPGGY